MKPSTPPFPENVRTTNLARISLSKLKDDDKDETARLFQACVETGCFTLDLNDHAHGVKLLSEVDEAFEIGKSFFDSPLDDKMAFKMNDRNIGYKPINTFKSKANSTDNVEIESISTEHILDPTSTSLPPQFSSHRPLLTSLISTGILPIRTLILDQIASYLQILPSTLQTLHSDPSATMLRFLHYLPSSPSQSRTSLHGHTDNGSLTLLFTRSIGGLQILPPHADATDEDSAAVSPEWEWVKPEEGCVFVNVGDSLVQWSGGILRAVYHRVVGPPGEQAGMERFSFGYFLKPGDGAKMGRIREGLVLETGEGKDDGEGVDYEEWHKSKSKKIYEGANGVSRGGSVKVDWRRE